MSWTCKTCSKEYEPSVLECLTCAADLANNNTDDNTGGPKEKYIERLTVCENCRHKHHDGVYCHIFIESSFNLAGTIKDEDADFDDGYVEPVAKEGERVPLNTPMFVKRMVIIITVTRFLFS